ncbi:MAG: HIT domain-containing protein [Candidatus Nomurabacteria bacterium]|jgi:histidine triad (HIT) family protein|nr:HIT domain-containing protein [Candidatus Nomurabacteria bacterium]
MEDSVFTKIISGELPSHKIYEDEKVLAFLTIQPETPGHTLVIPKIQVDKIYDVPDDYYCAMWTVAKKIAKTLDEVSGRRTVLRCVGFDVPHAHIHVFSASEEYIKPPEIPFAGDAELEAMATKLRTE